MHKFKVEDPAGHSVGSGEIIGLSAEQLASRGHRVEVLDEKRSAVTRVRVIEALQFKAGEVLHLDRAPKDSTGTPAAAKAPAAAPKREKRDANGDTREAAQLRGQFDASYAKQAKELEAAKVALEEAKAEGVKAGRIAMLEEIKARNAVFDAAEVAADAVVKAKQDHDAEPDAEKRKALQLALDAAIEAQLVADKAVEDLPEIEA